MRFLSVAAALSAVASVYAQNGSVITIQVGGRLSSNQNIYMFSPANVTAQQGDVVQFVFSGIPANHSVTQSTFSNPCKNIGGGFDSGWVAVPTNHDPNASSPSWNLTITDASKPLWFYCKQTVPVPHCDAGMVGSINAPTSGSNTFDNYVNNARGAGQPDQGIGGLVGQGASASALPGPITGDLQYFGTPVSGVASSTGTSSGNSPSGTNAATSTAFSGPLMLAVVALGAVLA